MIEVPEGGRVWLYGPAMINVRSDEVVEEEYGGVERLRGYLSRLMRVMGGVGIAAPQVGVFRRVIIMKAYSKPERLLVNPVIVGMYGKEVGYGESCLSVPPASNGCMVPRMQTVVVEHEVLLAGGGRVVEELSGMEAVIVQHEIDHLDGTFYFDRVAAKLREKVLQKLSQWKLENLHHVKADTRLQSAHR